MSALFFLIITTTVIIISVCGKRWVFARNYMFRCCFSVVFIYLMKVIGEDVTGLEIIGCNGITIAVSGLLGLPGLLIMYGINGFVL